MKQKLREVRDFIIKLLASRGFLWFVVILFALQALWIAFSFLYPMIYDEHYHYNYIQFYSHHLSPIIFEQPTKYDFLRDISPGTSFLYHYVMSFPYRLMTLFTDSPIRLIVGLRILNIALFAGGLLLFNRLFKEIGVKQIFINVGLLFFVLIPIVPFVGAHINYDNMLFPLVALFLLLCSRIILAKSINWKLYAVAFTVGMAAALVKYPFLPIFAVAVLFILFVDWRRHGRGFFKDFWSSLTSAKRSTIAIVAVPFVVFGAMFSYIYIGNVLQYGTPHPSCQTTMEKSRCAKSPVIGVYKRIDATKDERRAGPLGGYLVSWPGIMLRGMASTTGKTVPEGKLDVAPPLPIAYTSLVIFTMVGIAALLYAWRSLRKNRAYGFLMTITFFYILSVLAVNISAYYKHNMATAVQPRYLLLVLPFLIVMMVVAMNFVLRYRNLKLGLFAVSIVIFVIGGAALSTPVLRSNPTWYWQKQKVVDANCFAKEILRPVTIETGLPGGHARSSCPDNYQLQ